MGADSRLLVKNGVMFSIAPFLPKFVNILLLPIMTRYLTEVDYGISGTISAYTGAIGVFSTLGLGVVLMNSFYKSQDYKAVWRQIYGFLRLWMILFVVLQSVLLYFCIPLEAQENKWWIIAMSIFSTVLFGPVGLIGSRYYMYMKKSLPVVWRSVMASFITIAVDFLLIVYFKLGYMGWYVGGFVGGFVVNISYWYVVNRKLGLTPVYKFDFKMLKHALSVSLPTIPHYYTSYLLEGSGRMVMDRSGVSQGDIGRASIPLQWGDMFQTSVGGINQAVSPFFMQAVKNNDESKVKKIGLAFIAFVISAAFILAVWSKEIFGFLISNKTLSEAYPYFILYVMALCYRPSYCVASLYYFYYEKTKQLLAITFVSGLVAFLSYVVFVPQYGVWAFFYGHYAACLYYGYAGFFYSGFRKNAKVRFPVVLIFIVHILLTFAAFMLVERLMLKIIVSSLLLLFCGFIGYKFKYLMLK